MESIGTERTVHWSGGLLGQTYFPPRSCVSGRSRSFLAALDSPALLLALIWMLVESGTGSGDEARYRHLGRTARSYARISSVEKMLPRTVAGLFQLRKVEMRYQDKCEADLQGLIDSGYLCGARFTVSNLTANRKQVHNRVADALKGTGYWGVSLNLASNELTVYCCHNTCLNCGKP